jgi:hypothetical protein
LNADGFVFTDDDLRELNRKEKVVCRKKGVAQKKKRNQILRRLAAFFVGKSRMKSGFSARNAKLGHMKTLPT